MVKTREGKSKKEAGKPENDPQPSEVESDIEMEYEPQHQDWEQGEMNMNMGQDNTNRRANTLSHDDRELQRQSVSIKAVEAPMLKEYGRKEVAEFFDKKKKYENHCKQYGAMPISIRDMIDLNLRESICQIELEHNTTASEVGSEDLNQVLESYVNCSKNHAISPEEAFGEIEINLRISDPVSRVHDYSQRITAMLRENGWLTEYRGEKGGTGMKKKMIKLLLKGVRPIRVQELVQYNLDQLGMNEAVNERKFWNILRLHTLEQDKYHSYSKRKREDSERNIRKKQKKNEKGKQKEFERKAEDNDKKNTAKKSILKTTNCFGCNGSHRLADCRKYNDKEKMDIIAKKRAEWKQKKRIGNQ